MSCGVGCKCSLDPTLLWLWCRPAAAAPIRPLAWEPPYASGITLKSKKKKKITCVKSMTHFKARDTCGQTALRKGGTSLLSYQLGVTVSFLPESRLWSRLSTVRALPVILFGGSRGRWQGNQPREARYIGAAVWAGRCQNSPRRCAWRGEGENNCTWSGL